METMVGSQRIPALSDTVLPILRFMDDSTWARREGQSGICDFTFGNPHEMPLTNYVEALQNAIVPHNKDWLAINKVSRMHSLWSAPRYQNGWDTSLRPMTFV